MDPLQAQANYSKVCQLLIDKGGEALRRVLQTKIRTSPPPSTLDSLLNTHKKSLQKIRYSVINAAQWKLLFPPSGSADSNNFDITLLTILLRNICGLSSPAAGWNVMPPASDTSIAADILRIKMFRNEVYAHISSAQLDDTKFETLWQEISQPLIKLGIPQQDIDELKEAPLSPEEESYIAKLKEWKELEDNLISKQNDVEREVVNLKKKCVDIGDSVENIEETVVDISDSLARVENTVVKLQTQNAKSSEVHSLAKFFFKGKIEKLSNKFQPGTRKWFFDDFKKWFHDEKSSKVMILTAGPGVGKSVLSAKICELYEDSGQLAACHFCDFRTSDYRDPRRILQSLASQMCDNVDGFRGKLNQILCREHSQNSLSDAFRVLLNDPLSAMDRTEPMLIVVDALDESKSDQKSEFLELISDEFSQLPKWIKILITSRPEMQVRKKLEHLNPFEIRPNDKQHEHDLKQFIGYCLPNISMPEVASSLVKTCEGSFLYAYYLVNEVKHLGIGQNVDEHVPQGISGFYEKQFERLKTELQRYERNTEVSIFKIFLNLVAASLGPLPFRILLACIGLSNEEFEIRQSIIGIMSEILPVYDDCLTVFHKSLWDWLRLDGYEEHAYVADVADGRKRLWCACKQVYMDIDSLHSVSDFKISREKKYALENGWEYLFSVENIEDFPWLLNVKVNYLKFKYDDHSMSSKILVFKIFQEYKSKISDDVYLRLFQLFTFLRKSVTGREYLCDVYLRCFADKQIYFVHNTTVCMKDVREILEDTNQIWFEELTNETDFSAQIIAVEFLEIVWTISSSPDNKLVVCIAQGKDEPQVVVVYELPRLTLIFQLHELSSDRRNSCIVFSPDSSYFLLNSLQTCISIKYQSEVPFIPHGPAKILCCAFSSCGTKLVSLEEESIKVWDVRKKELLVESKQKFKSWQWVCFSDSDSCILSPPLTTPRVFDSTTLNPLEIKEISTFSARDDDCIQIIRPIFFSFMVIGSVKCWQLPDRKNIFCLDRTCSKPFTWNDQKCVMIWNGGTSLVVYNYITQEVVNAFHMSCLPNFISVDYISNVGENNFLICLDRHFVFVVSLERSSKFLVSPFISYEAYSLLCCALSPDNLYVACSYGCPTLRIMNVDNGKTLQLVEPKQKPIACWWSVLYLWVVCEGLVVVKYPYNATETQIVGNCDEECSFDCQGVILGFAEGVLVTEVNEKISISKICRENISQQIIDTEVNRMRLCKIAISTDGCAVLIYGWCESNYFQLWELGRDEKWELFWTGTLDYLTGIEHGYLAGGKNFRRVLLLSSSGIHNLSFSGSSHEHPNATQTYLTPSEFRSFRKVCIHHSNLLIGYSDSEIHFIRVSDGKSITAIYVGFVDDFFFVPSKRLLLLFRGGGVIEHFKIHNIDKRLPLPANLG